MKLPPKNEDIINISPIPSVPVSVNTDWSSLGDKNWDVAVEFDKANQNPFYAFNNTLGKTGEIYYATLDQTDNLYDEYVGQRACTNSDNVSMWKDFPSIYEKDQVRRAKGWYVERKKINSSKYQILVRGIAWSDCDYVNDSGYGYVKGALKINNNNGWEITKVDKCSAAKSNKGQETYCTTSDNEIKFAAGNNCGGCCACSDSGNLDIELLVEKQ